MYASVEDFVLRIGELDATTLSDRTHQGKPNEEVITIALEDSASQIDGYLRGRYRLPLPIVPRNVVRLCCDLARYRLCSMSGVTITEEVIERYKLCVKELEALASGKTSLDIEPSLLLGENGESDNTVQFSNSHTRIFSRDKQD